MENSEPMDQQGKVTIVTSGVGSMDKSEPCAVLLIHIGMGSTQVLFVNDDGV